MVNLERPDPTHFEMENGIPKGSPALIGKDEEEDLVNRTGNVWTASAHIITAVIGSGVLSLAWSIAQMGWIAGPVVLLLFAFVTYYTSILLADCYRSPDPVTGKRNHTYMEAIQTNLAAQRCQQVLDITFLYIRPVQVWMCGLVQYTNLWATAVGYTITAAISFVAIIRSDCFHSQGDNAACDIQNNPYIAGFGVVQIVFSQMPDFHKLWWLSYVAAVMSFTYSTIGLALGIGKLIEHHHVSGSITGISIGHAAGQLSKAQKSWQVLQSLGNIAFAYSFSMILIEIQDTIKFPPAENKTMKKATLIGVCTTTFFYMSIGCIGYAAFGNNAPGNLLTGFGFYNPYWLVDFANACVVVHLVGAYQVYSQPLFAIVEDWASKIWPKSRFIRHEYICKIPGYGNLPVNLFRLIWRTGFVIVTTLVAMLLPFFNDVVGLIGAYGFWPLTVYFPIEMYLKQKKIPAWSPQWIWLQILSVLCLIVSVVAAVGSVEGIIQDLKHYTPFKTTY